jgi:hypothetical protein
MRLSCTVVLITLFAVFITASAGSTGADGTYSRGKVPRGATVHWLNSRHTHGWALTPYVVRKRGAFGQPRTSLRRLCGPVHRHIWNGVCETFDHGSHWRLVFSNRCRTGGMCDEGGRYFDEVHDFWRTGPKKVFVVGFHDRACSWTMFSVDNGAHWDLVEGSLDCAPEPPRAVRVAGSAAEIAPAASDVAVHWSRGHHYAWTIDPQPVKSHGSTKLKWRCAPKRFRSRIADNVAICETFNGGKTWRPDFVNFDASNPDTGRYWNFLYTFLRTSSRDAIVVGGNGAYFEMYTNTNGNHWEETSALDPTHDHGCVQWPDYCAANFGTSLKLARITAATAPVLGGKPGGIVFSIGVPHEVAPAQWTYEPALFRVENWPVRGLNDPYPVRIF